MKKQIVKLSVIVMILIISLNIVACDQGDYDMVVERIIEEISENGSNDIITSVNVETATQIENNTTFLQDIEYTEEQTSDESMVGTDTKPDSTEDVLSQVETSEEESTFEDMTTVTYSEESVMEEITEEITEETIEVPIIQQEENTTIMVDKNIPVTGVKIDKTNVSLKVGETENISITVSPANATNKHLIFNSTNTKVATIDAYGKITANSSGYADIVIMTIDGGYSVECRVTVTEREILATNIIINKTNMTLNKGETETLIATIIPSNVTNKTIAWSSSNASVATVADGQVTAIGNGTATITAKTEEGSYMATCTVKVTTPVTGVKLDRTSINLTPNKTATLVTTISPSTASNKEVIWSSSNNSVATVNSSGKISAIGNGTATITVKTVDGSYKAICTVNVTTPVSGVKINKTSVNLKLNETETLSTTVLPSTASNKAVILSSSNNSVATVNSNGKITAVGNGTATITVKTVDGSYKATCVVKVTIPVNGVVISGNSNVALDFNHSQNKYYQCNVSVSPSNASNKTVTFKSSDTSIATVSSTGRVTALKRGVVTITVTTNDGSYKDSIKVYVYKSDAAVLPGGNIWYKIRSIENQNYIIDVTNGSTYNGAQLKLRSESTANAPYFQFHDYISKYGGLAVVPKCNSYCYVMDANRGSSYSDPLKAGNVIDLWALTAGDYEACMFELVRLWDDTMIIKLANYDLAVGVNSISEGAGLVLKKFDVFDKKQIWNIQAFDLGSSVVSPGVEKAISWAQERMNAGDKSYSYWCLKFIGDAFRAGGINNAGYSTATQAGNALITSTSTNPPRGAVVFWDWYGTIGGVYANYGHVGISLGNGKVIHADYDGIKITGLTLSGRTYRGWGEWK